MEYDDDNNYLNPDWRSLDDRPLSWRHYIAAVDKEHWHEYQKEIKRAIYHMAFSMMLRDVHRLDKDN